MPENIWGVWVVKGERGDIVAMDENRATNMQDLGGKTQRGATGGGLRSVSGGSVNELGSGKAEGVG